MNLDRQIEQYMDQKMEENVPNPYNKKKKKRSHLPLWAKICIPITAVAMTAAVAIPILNNFLTNNMNLAVQRLRGTYVDMENVKAFAICSPDAKTKAPKLSKISKLNAPDSSEEPENPEGDSEGDGDESEYSWTEEELELLSAFNIEYVAGSFIIFFLSEYANIHHNKHFTTVLFLGAFYDPVHQNYKQ